MTNKVLKVLVQAVIIAFIYLCVSFIWVVAEQLIYGSIQPRIVDNAVAVLLTLSVYKNLKITIQVNQKEGGNQ